MKGHQCDRGMCEECQSLRAMPRREFMEWFRKKYALEWCVINPDHLEGSGECRRGAGHAYTVAAI